MADYSELLPDDIWFLIGQKFDVAADRIRFRSVCTKWRSLLPFPQPPWLMMSEDENNPNTRGFFSLQQHHQPHQDVYQFELPEAIQTRCLGSTGTWLVTIDLHERICLLNPFSRVRFDLPSQQTFEFGPPRDMEISPKILRDMNTYKAIISSSPSSGDCSVVIIFYHRRKLAYARLGDTVWTTLPTPVDWFEDIIFYRNQIYGINIHGDLMVCELGDDLNPPAATLLSKFRQGVNDYSILKYLVEWMGELLFVIKFMDDDIDGDHYLSYKLNRFEIYKFDFAKKEWNELNNLGEYSLFLGFNTSIAILASQYSGLRKNCIYFTDDYRYGYTAGSDPGPPGGLEMGVVDLEDNSVQPHYKGISTSFVSPPLWIIP